MEGFDKEAVDTYRTFLLHQSLVFAPSTLVILLYTLQNKAPGQTFCRKRLCPTASVKFFIPSLENGANTRCSWKILKGGDLSEWEMQRSESLQSSQQLVEFESSYEGLQDNSLVLLSSRLGVESEELWEICENFHKGPVPNDEPKSTQSNPSFLGKRKREENFDLYPWKRC